MAYKFFFSGTYITFEDFDYNKPVVRILVFSILVQCFNICDFFVSSLAFSTHLLLKFFCFCTFLVTDDTFPIDAADQVL